MGITDAYEDHKPAFIVVTALLLVTLVSVPIWMFVRADRDTATLVWVSGTEYIGGENAQAIVRLVDYQNRPITANCTGTVLYPNKTVYYTSPMTLQSPFHNYYMTFTTPEDIGVYEEMAHCLYNNGNKEVNNTQTFHISNATNQIRRDISLGTNLTIKTINNQTTWINTSFNTTWELILAINQTGLNDEILQYLKINITDTLHNQTQQLTNHTENFEYQIGENETNQSVKSLLLQIWQNVTGFREPSITLTTEAPEQVIKGFDWYVKTRVSNEYNTTQTDSDFMCYVETDLLGNLTMPYEAPEGKFINTTTATTTGLMNFTVKCWET